MALEHDNSRTKYRSLTAEEIELLTSRQCVCENWSEVQVAENFSAESIWQTHFCGRVRLGTFDKRVTFPGGLSKPAGIYNATIHNCTIGDNVYISNVRNYIANYIIEDDVVIENIDLLAVEDESSFGNGAEVAVVNEAGGREIPIYDRLTAQLAYVIAFYRHRPAIIDKLREMIDDYTRSVTGNIGLVQKGARLIDCRIIKNVKIGPSTLIEGVNKLEDGSVNSSPADPVYIGPGVFAEHFIISSGSTVSDGAIIHKCFVGQGTELSKQYSAENSVFFANCGGFHGEACAIFAGPYTVTHHKSTLLIAGLFSFLNAGSGTNQSNHMYKLGPVHQGVVERGSKTASDSYMLWPAKVGAFTVVMGRHYRNSDTSDLPFSYLIEHEDESILAPGVNLRSVGTVRDARKWPSRDRRKDPDKLDLINFKLLSPYTVQKMLNGRRILMDLKAASGGTSDYFTYHSVKISNASLDRGINFYEIGISKFLGNCLINRLENRQFENVGDLRETLKPRTDIGGGKWIDLAGLFAPEETVRKMLDEIENGTISTLQQVSDTFESIHENYPEYEWTWAANAIRRQLGKTLEQVTPGDIIDLTAKWKKAVIELDNMLYSDAGKEFTATAQIGYGIDDAQVSGPADFAQVRGTFENNSFVMEIQKHIDAKTKLGDGLIDRVKKIS